MNKINLNNYLDFLIYIRNESNKSEIIKEFQNFVWNIDKIYEFYDLINELAYDLDYYEADPNFRAEDASYYGEERLKEEIDRFLESIKKDKQL